jgi:hypothetical protein
MTPLDSSHQRAEVFTCWKEIAAYLQAGVRTVQRWEHEEHLPVRRPTGTSAGIVSASRADLDLWLAARQNANSIQENIGRSLYLHAQGQDLVRQLLLEIGRFDNECKEFAKHAERPGVS